MNKKEFDLNTPFPDLFPAQWKETMGECDFMQFRNLDHFKHYVSKLGQKEDDKCGMTYQEALRKLIAGESDFPKEEQSSIRNLVRSNLHKRGLITQEVYENFRYDTQGTQVDVDVGKYAAGEPDCVIVPSVQYVDFFYELYVSISYPWNVSNEKVRNNVAKLLATVEELERKHIFIKIVLVFADRNATSQGGNFFSAVPLFSHKTPKSVESMSAVVNERLLRKFFFAVLEDLYKENLSYNYGYPATLKTAMNIGKEFNEIEFFTHVMDKVGIE